MGLRFRLLLAAFFLISAPFALAAGGTQTEQNSDSLEMIAERMRSLTNSLEKMPEPPAFDQKIQLPGAFLPLPKHSETSNDDNYLEKEKDE